MFCLNFNHPEKHRVKLAIKLKDVKDQEIHPAPFLSSKWWFFDNIHLLFVTLQCLLIFAFYVYIYTWGFVCEKATWSLLELESFCLLLIPFYHLLCIHLSLCWGSIYNIFTFPSCHGAFFNFIPLITTISHGITAKFPTAQWNIVMLTKWNL